MTDDVWQPSADDPLLTPEMTLGPHAVGPLDAQRLGNYLSALVEARRGPVHVNVAFNAVYFGYDLSNGGYVGPFDLDAFPVVTFGKATEALPVGAMVNIATGSEPLFAEVMYKEGKHDLLDEDGTLPSWISGAPAGATGPGEAGRAGTTARVERLVVDVDAFGQGLSTTTPQLDRLRRRGKWLDVDGHLVLKATYDSPSDAKLDDAASYARYLLTRGRNQLLSAAAPAPLSTLLTGNAGAEQLTIALAGIQRTLAAILASAEELRMWRGYAFTRRSLARRLHDQGPLGEADMSYIAVQLARSAVLSRVSRWRSTPSAAYTAIGPRLREVNGARASLAGLGYAEAVCHANAIISDYACRETNEETGLLPGDVHLRLDDPWQGGGVWRAEHPTSNYVAIGATEPLGLGWLATLPEPELIADRHDEDDAVDLSVTDSQISWTQPLRLTHMLDRHTPLPDRVATHIRAAGLDSARMRLLLAHDGYELDPSETDQCGQARLAGKPRLEGIEWPIKFFPGILLTYTWSYGAGVLRATTTLLDYLVTVDGKEIEHRYVPGILTREMAPGMGGRGKSVTLTLAQRVLGAVRRQGLLDPDGRAMLTRSGVAALVYNGHETNADKAALEPIIAELIDAGHVRVVDGSVSEAGRVVYPAVPGHVHVALLVYEPRVVVGPPVATRSAGGRALDRRFPCQHPVAPHLRRIAGQASEAQRRAYRKDRPRFGIVGPEELPPTGYTYIPSFSRGHR